MKKFIAVMLVVVTILGLIPDAFAKYEPQFVTVNVDGKSVNVKKIRVLVNDEEIETDVPPILYQERTLVPIRFAENYLNAQIEWKQDTKEAFIKTANRDVVLTVDSSDVIVNGKTQKIPYNVPAKLVNDARIMVPLRFVIEVLGFPVEWDEETWTASMSFGEGQVSDISLKSSNERLSTINLTGSSILDYEATLLENPYRLVIDIPNSKLNIKNSSLLDSKGIVNFEVDKYPVKSMRASQFSENPNVTRFVIELEDLVEYELNLSSDYKNLAISFVNKITNIEIEEIDGREAIVIDNTERPIYNILKFENPDRIAIDVMDSVFADDVSVSDIESDSIKSIRTSSYKPEGLYNEHDKVVRIVFDIKESVDKSNMSIEEDGNKIILYADNKGNENISYVNSKDEGNFIQLDTVRNTSYDIDYDEDKKQMEVKIPKRNVKINNGIIAIKDNIVDTIEVREEGIYKLLTISFKNKIKYEAIDDINKTIKIEILEEVKKYGDRLIVIDAGHGGKDPGAIGTITKTAEKELNLKVALKLRDKLEELGFNTILTRDKDEFVDLTLRADIANRNNADAFISIHFNANNDKSIYGVQTLYCPAYAGKIEKEGDNYPFAEAMHKGVLGSLGSVDKRIVQRPDLRVLNSTKMVAVLLELGFLTNAAEEAKIIKDSYHDKAVEGIANGLVNYFEKMK